MRRLMSVLSISLITIAGSIASPAVATAATPSDRGAVPAGTSCSTGYTVYQKAPYNSGNGRSQGLLELRYNSCNRTIWARITTNIPHGCQPFVDYCGYAGIHRNQDGAVATKFIAAGATSAYTAPLNDAGYTSHAEGNVDLGAYSYGATTSSY